MQSVSFPFDKLIVAPSKFKATYLIWAIRYFAVVVVLNHPFFSFLFFIHSLCVFTPASTLFLSLSLCLSSISVSTDAETLCTQKEEKDSCRVQRYADSAARDPARAALGRLCQ